MTISLIAAVSENRVIGCDNTLPWHLPADLRHFRRMTMGHPIIMGRKTWQSIGSKPLPGRRNIVLSRVGTLFPPKDVPLPEGAAVANSFREAITKASHSTNGNEIFVIGGAEVFRQALNVANRIYLTIVHTHKEGDALFPELGDTWREASRDFHRADAENIYDHTFLVYEREPVLSDSPLEPRDEMLAVAE